MAIGDNIRKFRKEKGYTQKQLAEKAGIATITLQQYELGKREPKLEQLLKISTALQIDINFLLESIDTPLMKIAKQKDSFLYNNLHRQQLSESVELTELDVELIKLFHKLNTSGKSRAIEYVTDLLKIKSYINDKS